jgi:hypothetical protein
MLGAVLVAILSVSASGPAERSRDLDPDEFLSQFKLQEAAVLSTFAFEGVIHRPARTAAAGETRELVTFASTGSCAAGKKALRWELLDWDTPSYAESVDAIRQYLLPPWTEGDPVDLVRVSSRSAIADAVSIRLRDDHAIVETLAPDSAPVRKSGATVEYWEHDAHAPGVLHELEKIVWASGHGIAPLLLTVESVVRAESGIYDVRGGGKLDLREKRIGEWALKVERVGDAFVVRHAEFFRAGSSVPAWTLETQGQTDSEDSAGSAVAANGLVRFWDKDGTCTTRYDISIAVARAELDVALIERIDAEHEGRHAALVLSEHDCRGGRVDRTTYRDGRPTSLPHPNRGSENP